MFFSLELNENSQIPVKKRPGTAIEEITLNTSWKAKRKRRLKKEKKETLRAFTLDRLPKASLEEIASFGLALGFDYFHICGYTPINVLNVLVSIVIMKSDVNSKTFWTVFTTLKNLHIHSAKQCRFTA